MLELNWPWNVSSISNNGSIIMWHKELGSKNNRQMALLVLRSLTDGKAEREMEDVKEPKNYTI